MPITSNGYIRQMEQNKPRGKCKKWQLRVRTGLNPRTGKYGEKTRTFNGSYREAQRALADFIDELENRQSTAPGRKLTFEQLAEEYVKHRLDLKQINKSTADKIQGHLDALSRHVGKCPIDKLETYMIQDAVKAMMQGDSASGQPLSGTYVNMILQSASTMYTKYAIPQQMARRNPFEGVERPRDDTQERQPLTEDQQKAIEDSCTPTNHRHAAVMLALWAGLRRNESCRLRWSDVDLIDGFMMLPDTKAYGNKLKPIPIQEKLVEYLLAWKEEQARLMKKWKVDQCEETYVCANELGDRLNDNVLGRWWRRNRKKYNCDEAHFHDLRHTFATNLAKKNIHPKVIQDLLRQKDDRVAMKVYTHVNTQQMEDALRLL